MDQLKSIIENAFEIRAEINPKMHQKKLKMLWMKSSTT